MDTGSSSDLFFVPTYYQFCDYYMVLLLVIFHKVFDSYGDNIRIGKSHTLVCLDNILLTQIKNRDHVLFSKYLVITLVSVLQIKYLIYFIIFLTYTMFYAICIIIMNIWRSRYTEISVIIKYSIWNSSKVHDSTKVEMVVWS